MQFRLKTSGRAHTILKDLYASTKITPNILARLAFSLSLMNPEPIENFQSDTNNGMEFNRPTLTGDHDILYRCLLMQREQRFISDDEFFPRLMKLHIDRGVEQLWAEYRYTGSYERFITHLTKIGVDQV